MKALEYATKVIGRLPAMIAAGHDVSGFVTHANDLLVRVQKEGRELTVLEEAELNEQTDLAKGRTPGQRVDADNLNDKGITDPPHLDDAQSQRQRHEASERSAQAAEAERLKRERQ